MKKQIIIEEHEDGTISLNAKIGVRWSTFLTAIEMLIECIKENAQISIDINDILDDVKRIYLRDREKKEYE